MKSKIIVLLVTAMAAAAGTIVNPSFETLDVDSMPVGWSLSPAGSGSNFVVDTNPETASEGLISVYFAGRTSGSYDLLTQTLSTSAGGTYQLSFWLKTGYDHTDADFMVFWNGSLIYDDPPGADEAHQFPYTQINIAALVATGTTATLTFAGYNTLGADYIDNLSLSEAVPSEVPEVSTWILTGLGMLLLGGLRNIQRQRSVSLERSKLTEAPLQESDQCPACRAS